MNRLCPDDGKYIQTAEKKRHERGVRHGRLETNGNDTSNGGTVQGGGAGRDGVGAPGLGEVRAAPPRQGRKESADLLGQPYFIFGKRRKTCPLWVDYADT